MSHVHLSENKSLAMQSMDMLCLVHLNIVSLGFTEQWKNSTSLIGLCEKRDGIWEGYMNLFMHYFNTMNIFWDM